MIAAMEIDSYWRTRSIGEAQGEGYTHLRATCPNCGRIADVPWPLLLGRKGTNRNTFLGNIPLKCQRCGNTNPAIGVRELSPSWASFYARSVEIEGNTLP
jgi:ribosomal protein S27AE